MKYIAKYRVFAAILFSVSFIPSAKAFDGVVLKCSLRFSDLPTNAPTFTSWEIAILPSGNAAIVKPSSNNVNPSLIYRGSINKMSFDGVNDKGLKMSIRRKDGQIEVKDSDAQPGFVGSCERTQVNDIF